MYVIINFNIEICIPQSNSSSKIYLCLGRQFQITFNMILLRCNTDVKSNGIFYLMNQYSENVF